MSEKIVSEKLTPQEYIKELEKRIEEVKNVWFWCANEVGPSTSYYWWVPKPTATDIIEVCNKLSDLNNECARLKYAIEKRISEFTRPHNCELKDDKITFSFKLYK